MKGRGKFMEFYIILTVFILAAITAATLWVVRVARETAREDEDAKKRTETKETNK